MADIGKIAGNAATQAVNSPGTIAGAPGQKDADSSSTEAQFGDVLKKIQAQVGGKAEKPREIKKTLGKDDFLRLMITQMQHQDPTNPFKAEQMAQEMAQFASVEQLSNINQNMQKLTTQNQPLEKMAMTNLIGKTVTVDKDRFPHVEGQNESLTYKLPRDAANVKVALIHESGEVILEKDIGKQGAGEGTFLWDGKKSNTLPAKPGTYIFRVEAKDENGAAIQIDSRTKAKVVGVSFEGADPVLLVGDANRQDKITMKNVVKIETDGNAASPSAPATAAPAGAPPVANGATKPSAPESNGAPNFFTFQKGVGSSNLDASKMNAEAQKAINGYMASQAAPRPQAPAQGQAPAPLQAKPAGQAQAQVYNDGEKGFPNGLSN